MRLNELDSLRGIAALTVLICHFMGVFQLIIQDSYIKGLVGLNWIKYTPLHIFWAGHEAVILFFILSGFVLSLPFFCGKVNYIEFLVKRICRIYIPYLVAIIFSLLGLSTFSQIVFPQLSSWFNGLWKSSLSFSDIVSHLSLIGYFDPTKIDNPIWSLVHEMRISIIFPFIVILLVLNRNFKVSLFAGGLLYIAGWSLYKLFPNQNIMLTLQYTFMFIIGAVLANNYKVLVYKYNSLGLFGKISVGLIGLTSYTYSWLFYGQTLLHRAFINDWMTSIGASIFIIMAISNNEFLLLRPLKFLGNVSYSLYLLHLPILIIVMRINNGRIPIWLNLLTALVLSLVLSNISYLYIEKPSISLGKRISKGLSSKLRNYYN